MSITLLFSLQKFNVSDLQWLADKMCCQIFADDFEMAAKLLSGLITHLVRVQRSCQQHLSLDFSQKSKGAKKI